MSIDYKEFEMLLRSFEKTQRSYDKFLHQFLTQMGLRVLGKTKARTPRDLGAGGGLVSRWELTNVYRDGDDLCIDLFNPLEYASFVEDGHMQHKRFLPLSVIEARPTPHGRKFVASVRAKYGPKVKGVMLKEKWIPGHHMARVSLNEVNKEIPARYKKAFEEFLKSLGAV